MLQRIATWSFRHRWTTLLLWITTLAVLAIGLVRLGGQAFSTEFKLGGSDSSAATESLQREFTDSSGDVGNIVFRADAGIADAKIKKQMQSVFADIQEIDHVSRVSDPYTRPNPLQVSSDGKTAIGIIQFDTAFTKIPRANIDDIKDIAARARVDGLQIELGGQAFQGTPTVGPSEAVGLIAAVVILVISFGSILAAGLPIIMALFGIGVGVVIIQLLTHVLTIPTNAMILALMIGLGVGIDYALLIVTRYRQELHGGKNPEQAVVTAINTAGRSVLFAGSTVVVSLLGMFLINIEFIQTMSLSSGLVVIVTMIASITLLPALLGFVGRRIDSIRIPGMGAVKPAERTLWHRWSGFLQRHPWPPLIAGFALLLVLAAPILSMQLGFSDASSRPGTDTTRRAYDLTTNAFGAGVNGPLFVVATMDDKGDVAVMWKLATTLSLTDGVKTVSPPQINSAGTAAVIQVIPTTSPQDKATSALIRTLRTNILPSELTGTGVSAHVGGPTAIFDDIADKLQTRLPVFIGAVLIVSAILLMAVFRSVLVPIKAVLMNLMSIGAAYGILVAIFQWGWLESVFGKGPIESFLPMMLFAILFGLSMDYEVFLLSRIKEEYDRTGDNRTAVANGLSATARIITAAAAIMVIVFLAFATSEERILKEFGLGLAVAVFLDATIVRMVLVPATMELLGKANWWLPRWLRWLPQLQVESVKEKPSGRK
jgi:RND superfamily putative drug exporter